MVEEKFRNRKIKILGRQIPVIALLIVLAAGLGSAALVTYLSNTITANIEVTSPMVTGISLGKDSWSTTQCVNKVAGNENYDQWVDSFPECDFPDIQDWTWSDWEITETPLQILVHGGETVTLYTMSENIADAEISGFEEAIVTNWAGVTCEDFESIIVRVDSIYGSLGYGTPKDVIDLGACFVIDEYHIQFGSPDNSLWGTGETDVSEIVVTFEEAALGTYTFTYRVIPAVG